MTQDILRVRLRDNAVSKYYPWRLSYILPAERRADIFRLFGRAYSVPFTSTHAKAVHSCNSGIHVKHHTRVEENEGKYLDTFFSLQHEEGTYLVVVPLPVYSSGKIPQMLADRMWNNHLYSDSEEETVKTVGRLLPPNDVLLYLGPKAEDTTQICNKCSQQPSYLMHLCTPGMQSCAENVLIPHDTIARNTPRRTKLSAREQRRRSLPTIR